MNECGSFIPVSKLILFLTFELKVSDVSPNPETCPKFEKVWAAKFAEGALHKIVTVHLSRNTHHISVRSTCYGLGLLSSLFECTMCVFVFFIWAVCVFVFLYYCIGLPGVILLPPVFLWLLFIFCFVLSVWLLWLSCVCSTIRPHLCKHAPGKGGETSSPIFPDIQNIF